VNKLLVTGGMGFIGSEFVRQESDRKKFKKIFVLDSFSYAANPDSLESTIKSRNVEIIRGDINDVALVSELISQVDGVVNFAAESHVDNSILDIKPFLKSNIMGVANLLEAARKHKIQRFVQISTDEVYGSIPDGSFKEDDRLNPRNPYSASKASAEFLCNSFQNTYGLDVVITRTCNNYGPFQQFEKFIPTALKALIDGRKIPVYGDGSQVREWIHVSDNCRAITEVLEKGLSGSIYNIGTSRHIRNLDLARLLIAELGLNEKSLEFVPDRPGHDQRYSISSAKIKNELNWSPQIEFEDGLKETVKWYQERLRGV
jgi:dTDP-glucose 4,6-dehydratase